MKNKKPRRGVSAWETVYRIVARIPRGRVMSYGQISRALGARLSPLAVGWALHVAPAKLPWHRVVCAKGELAVDRRARAAAESSGTPTDLATNLQRRRLAAEGVRFDARGCVRMTEHTYAPRRQKSTAKR
ncbi:MAG: MGMT family protein [Planctomycetota bacterium]